MRTVDLIHRKRDGEELSPEEIATLVDGYNRNEIPDYQMSAFLMAVFFSGMSDREVSALTEFRALKWTSIPPAAWATRPA
jgi:pyrimidine-nucleoside phosphorylase